MQDAELKFMFFKNAFLLANTLAKRDCILWWPDDSGVTFWSNSGVGRITQADIDLMQDDLLTLQLSMKVSLYGIICCAQYVGPT